MMEKRIAIIEVEKCAQCPFVILRSQAFWHLSAEYLAPGYLASGYCSKSEKFVEIHKIDDGCPLEKEIKK